MKQGTYYSIKELAERLDMDWETLLKWKYQYLFDLPAHPEENQLKYPAQTAAIFQFIKQAKAYGLHDDVIQLWVDKQAEKCRLHHPDLSAAMQTLIQDLQVELSLLHSQWEQKHIQQQEYLLSMMENVTWKELQLLQKRCPDLLTLEEDIPVKSVRKGPVSNFFERVIYN